MATRQFVHITLSILLMFTGIAFLNAPVPFEQLPEKSSERTLFQRYGLKISAALATLAAALAIFFNLPEEGNEPVTYPARQERTVIAHTYPSRETITAELAFKAARTSDPILENWINNGSVATAIRDEYQNTLLIAAVRYNKRLLFDFLLDKPNLQQFINEQNDEGDTALIIAARNNRLNFVTTLLLKNADKTIRNNEGKTARDVAPENIQGYIDRR